MSIDKREPDKGWLAGRLEGALTGSGVSHFQLDTEQRHEKTLQLLCVITLLGEALHDFESLRFAPLLADDI